MLFGMHQSEQMEDTAQGMQDDVSPAKCIRCALYSCVVLCCPASSAGHQMKVQAQILRPQDAIAGHAQLGGAVSACTQGCLRRAVFSAVIHSYECLQLLIQQAVNMSEATGWRLGCLSLARAQRKAEAPTTLCKTGNQESK